jgi:hypothetical protein
VAFGMPLRNGAKMASSASRVPAGATTVNRTVSGASSTRNARKAQQACSRATRSWTFGAASGP